MADYEKDRDMVEASLRASLDAALAENALRKALFSDYAVTISQLERERDEASSLYQAAMVKWNDEQARCTTLEKALGEAVGDLELIGDDMRNNLTQRTRIITVVNRMRSTLSQGDGG